MIDVEIHLLQEADVLQGALDQRLRGRTAMAGGNLLLQGAGIDSDPDHLPVCLGHRHDLADAFGGDIAGIDPDAVRTVVHGQEGKSMVEMDIGDQRDMDPGLDLVDGGCRRFIGNGDTDDFTTRLFQLMDLLDRGLDIARVAGGHGLDHDRCIAADLHPPERDGFCLSSSDGRTQTDTLSLRVCLCGFTITV